MIKEFYEKNKKIFCAGLVFSFFCFGFMLTHYMVNIDEETWLLQDSDSLLWLFQGRYGLYIYDFLFTKYGRFVPFFSDVVSIVFWNISGLVFAYVFFDFEKKEHWWIRLIMLCYYSSLPLCVGEAFAFTMQMIPESFAMILTAAAFTATVKPWLKNKKINLAFIIGLLIIALGVYQALINVYITAVAAWCFCRFLEKETIKQGVWTGVFCSIISAAVYYIINYIIGNIIGTAAYLTDNYIGWKSGQGIGHALFMACANVVRVSFGVTIQEVYVYGAVPLRILMILFLTISVFGLLRKKEGIKRTTAGMFFLGGLVMAPFATYLAMGTYKTQGRMLLALSLSGMVEILVVYQMLSQKFFQKAAVLVFSGILAANASNMNQIYYHSYLAYQQDKTIADEIMYEIQRLGYNYHAKPVVFIGSRERDAMPVLKSGTLGGSFFEWDGGNISRLIDFMELEGYALRMPSAGQIEEGLARSKDMKTWPQEGSIIETDDSIVVYLSEPSEKWYGTNLRR